jgi:class 3 adenylate cyclase/tetratricopeptide (TPR) repeat protein
MSCAEALKRVCSACGAEAPPEARFCMSCAAPLEAPVPPTRTPTPAPSPALPASFAGGRYQVKRFLGEGGRKRVYLAHDARLDRDVAFSLIKTEGLDEAGQARIRREAQAMGRLGDHPNIVTVFDIGEENPSLGSGQAPQPYIVSQYMAGGDLEGLLQQAENRRLPLDQALRIADQVRQALEHAHGRGIVHRDLKPGNIWLTEEGTAKLGDFGLAMAVDLSRVTQAGMMLGTVAYMPPEQAMGETADARSDLYSLGCVLYEMVTGRPPFLGDDTVAVITQHLNTPPVSPSWHRPDLPPPLETLILRLLEKDPAQRPASASEAGQSLDSIDLAQPAAPAEAPAEPAPATGQSPLYRRTFVGREAELRQLQTAFDNALSGQGALLMVVGEPGIGKTALCEQLATYVTLRGGRPLVGHCYEEGSLSLPYLPFVEALRSYVLAREPDDLKRELGSGADEVARIVSEIRERVEVELSPPGDPEEERYRLLQAVTAFLRNAATVQPLFIVLEDLHDADRGTLDLLTHVARNLAGMRLLIVGTYRDVEVDRAHPLSGALAELRRVTTFSRVLLRGLSPDEVQRMLSSIANQEIPWGLAEAVHRQTEGNPLFIQEVLRYLVEEGLVSRDEGQWRQTGETPLAMSIPEGLRDVIGKRLSRLSPECNSLLSVAAVIGREFALETLRAVAGMLEEALLAALEEAVRVAVLEERSRVGEIRYRFAHAFFRQTLYEEMIAPRRLRLHQQVARALEEQYVDRVEEHATELAEHFSHSSDAGDLAKAVQYGEMAARRAAATYAHGEAVRVLEQALQVQEVLDPDDKARRCDLLLALGQAILPTGEPRRAVDVVAPEALALAEALDDRGRASQACGIALEGLWRFAGMAITATSDYREWAERADRCADPGTSDRVHADIALSYVLSAEGRRREARALMRPALELARRLDDPEALFLAAASLIFWGGAPEDQEERLRLAEEFISRPREGVSTRTLALLLNRSAHVFLDWGERARAEELSRQTGELAARTRDAWALMFPLVNDAVLGTVDGRLEDAVAAGERLVARGDELGLPVIGRLLAVAWTARSLLYLGRGEEILAALPQVFQLVGVGEMLFGLPAARALTLAHVGRLDEAGDDLRQYLKEPGIDEDTSALVLLALLQTAVLVEDREATALLAPRVSGLSSLATADTSLTTVARRLGAAAALLEELEKARAYYEQALEVAGKIGFRPEVALTRLQLAELLLEHYPDERADALQHLDFAIAECREMKMRPSLERALRLKMEAQGVDVTSPDTSIDAVAASVEIERPDLRPHAAPDGTVTILFTDIEGSTEMTERLGDRRWLELLREHNAIVREQVAAHEGFEVKAEGDGFMLAFQSARRALQCAVDTQRAFAEYNAARPEPVEGRAEVIKVRIGLHTGEAIKEADDFYGKNVILAARIAAQARGGDILVSSLLKELTESAGDIAFGEGREVELKGLSGRHRVFEVVW